MSSRTASSVADAFTEGAGVAPYNISLLFIAVSIGLLLVFGIFLILKKATQAKQSDYSDFFKTTGIFILILVTLIIVTALVTVAT